jgi:hypothetical protein
MYSWPIVFADRICAAASWRMSGAPMCALRDTAPTRSSSARTCSGVRL